MQSAQASRHLDDQVREVDLRAVAGKTWEQLAESSTNHSATTLIKQPGIRAVLLTLEKEALIPEHSSEYACTVQVLTGEIELKLEGRVSTLRKGELLAIAAGVPHDLKGMVRSEVLLTLGG